MDLRYNTISGDTFDSIAFKHYGNEKLAIQIMRANIEFVDVVIFGAGSILKIPRINEESTSKMPPWKRGGDS